MRITFIYNSRLCNAPTGPVVEKEGFRHGCGTSSRLASNYDPRTKCEEGGRRDEGMRSSRNSFSLSAEARSRGKRPSVDQPKNRREWADNSVRSPCCSPLIRLTSATWSLSCLISRMTTPNVGVSVRSTAPPMHIELRVCGSWYCNSNKSEDNDFL